MKETVSHRIDVIAALRLFFNYISMLQRLHCVASFKHLENFEHRIRFDTLDDMIVDIPVGNSVYILVDMVVMMGD